LNWTSQMANELEKMISDDEIDNDFMDEIMSVVHDLREGNKALIDFYRPSSPQKLLDVLDEVNQRVKR
jgi:uncharacterized membrane protein